MALHESLEGFLRVATRSGLRGPVALIVLEDMVEVDTTLRHHLDLGFRTVVAFGVEDIRVNPNIEPQIERVIFDVSIDNALSQIVNGVAKAAPGQWIYYCFNAEYLFFPFCEHRSVSEMIGFCTEERRESVLTYVVDLYADDLRQHPTAVSLDHAHLDKSGYYALARKTAEDTVAERQLDFFGGLRWRYEEHIPAPRRRIDRVSLFRAKPGLTFREDHTLSEPEYNTYACPWHHSLTATVCSFRTAKALKRNPGSSHQINSFMWHNSAPFEWHSQQLLNLGLMEPGQWF